MRIFLFILLLTINLPASSGTDPDEIKTFVTEEKKLEVQKTFNKFIRSLGKKKADYNLEIVTSDVLNAYASSGNRIVINSALINYLDSPAALAFVIAHELGHIESKHVIKGAARNGLSALLKTFFFKESKVYMGADYFHNLYYTRDHERDADYFAVDLINKFYCDVPNKLEFFKKIRTSKKEEKFKEYFSTHPLPQSRIKYLKEEINEAGCVF